MSNSIGKAIKQSGSTFEEAAKLLEPYSDGILDQENLLHLLDTFKKAVEIVELAIAYETGSYMKRKMVSILQI